MLSCGRLLATGMLTEQFWTTSSKNPYREIACPFWSICLICLFVHSFIHLSYKSGCSDWHLREHPCGNHLLSDTEPENLEGLPSTWVKLTLHSCGFSSSVFMLLWGRGDFCPIQLNVILTAKRSPEESLSCFPAESQFQFTVAPLKNTFLFIADNQISFSTLFCTCKGTHFPGNRIIFASYSQKPFEDFSWNCNY